MERAIEALKAAQSAIEEDIATHDQRIAMSRSTITKSKASLKLLHAQRDQMVAAINKLGRSR